MSDTFRSPAHRFSAAAGNLLPLFGMLALGWEAAGVVFLLWVDGFLGILELGARACVHATREERAKNAEARGCVWAVGWPIGLLIGVAAMTAPALVAGAGLIPLLERAAPGAPWLGIPASRGIVAAALLDLALRAVPIVLILRSEHPASFREAAPQRYILLAVRCAFLFFLALLARGLGRWGLGAFVVVAAAVLAWMEWNEDKVIAAARKRGM